MVVKRHLIPSEVHDLLHKSGHHYLYTGRGTVVVTIKRKRKSVGDELRRGEIRESSGWKGGVGLWGFSGAGHVVSEEAPITYHAVFSIAPSASPAPSRNHNAITRQPLHHQLGAIPTVLVFPQVFAFVQQEGVAIVTDADGWRVVKTKSPRPGNWETRDHQKGCCKKVALSEGR